METRKIKPGKEYVLAPPVAQPRGVRVRRGRRPTQPRRLFRATFIERNPITGALKFRLHRFREANEFFGADPTNGECEVKPADVLMLWDENDPFLKEYLAANKDAAELDKIWDEFGKMRELLTMELRVMHAGCKPKGVTVVGPRVEVGYNFDTTAHGYFRNKRGYSDGYSYGRPSYVKEDETEREFLERMRKANWAPMLNRLRIELVYSDQDSERILNRVSKNIAAKQKAKPKGDK